MRTTALITTILFLALTACSQSGRVENNSYGFLLNTLLNHSVPELDVSAAEALSVNAKFVDARESPEFNVSHIKDATWVGYEDFDPCRMTGISKQDTVIVYCSVGYRSEKIAEKLDSVGYLHVWNLYGGIFEWKNQGHPVVDSTGKPTEKVHAYDKNWGRWLMEGEKVYE